MGLGMFLKCFFEWFFVFFFVMILLVIFEWFVSVVLDGFRFFPCFKIVGLKLFLELCWITGFNSVTHRLRLAEVWTSLTSG